MADRPVSVCWSCAWPIEPRAGVVVGKGGACSKCINDRQLKEHEVAPVLPHVWGERKSRLDRVALILRALGRVAP